MNNLRPATRFTRRYAAVGIAIVAVNVGCGPPATVITGSVTLDGQPVPNASLEFFPVSGKGRVSYTTTDASGRYQVPSGRRRSRSC